MEQGAGAGELTHLLLHRVHVEAEEAPALAQADAAAQELEQAGVAVGSTVSVVVTEGLPGEAPSTAAATKARDGLQPTSSTVRALAPVEARPRP